jgi:hypothetical protein
MIIDVRRRTTKRISKLRTLNGVTWAPANEIVYLTDKGGDTQAKCGD